MSNSTNYYIKIVLLFFIWYPVHAGDAGDSIPNLAVLDFEGNGLSENEAKILTDKLRFILVNSKKYSILERKQMAEILKEQGFQKTGCTTDECAVEIGQLLNISKIVAGSIGAIGNSFLLTSRIIDVRTGKIIQMSKIELSGSIKDVLRDGIEDLATNLLKNEKQDSIKDDDKLNKINEENIRKMLIGQLNGELRDIIQDLSPNEIDKDPFWRVADLWPVQGKKEYVASVEFNFLKNNTKVILRTYRYFSNDGTWHQSTSKYKNK